MMDPPYTSEEIEKAAGKLKKKKAVGRDEVQAELIKYGCNELYIYSIYTNRLLNF